MKIEKSISIIPKPVSLKVGDGSFKLNSESKIFINPGTKEIRNIGKFLAEKIDSFTGYNIKVIRSSNVSEKGNIYVKLKTGEKLPGMEGYKLIVNQNKILLSAFRPSGLFRGIQTLRQLFPPLINSLEKGILEIPACTIIDYPRFQWRGAMIDVARHFFEVSDIKRFIDLISYYKINKLHIHLSDDQGWRISIDSWSKLASYGGSSEVGGGTGGFYTKKDFSEIVSYAQSRYITVIPEIDMPGHTNAALSSYAELNENGIASQLYTGIQVGFSSLAIRKNITYTFIDNVIKELCELTPGNYIHIGGDEAKEVKLDDYIYFINRVQDIIKRYNKKMIGWEEISQAHLNSTSIVQHWAKDLVLKAVAQGSKVIMSPASKAYLDIKYNSSTELGQNWAGYIEIKDSYNWDPAKLINGIKEKDILGVEAALWTETIKTIFDIEYMVFPRLCSIAEIGWSQSSNRNWNEFKKRLANHGVKLKEMGVNFYRSPQIAW